ncbi:MAG: putative circadian clock protein KaiC [Fibrobacteres bacterium]|nr:putative circadian clock protein KaiC [Fibrobacterota bacterium]
MTSSESPICQTGIAGLDQILRGGLPRHRFYMIQGDPGVGKTTLALQFLLNGTKQGEKGLYITLSETRDELLAVAKSHDWNLDHIEILELTSMAQQAESQNTLFHPSEVELMQTVETVLARVENAKPDRVVIDSLSEFRLLAHDALRYRRQMLSFKQYFAANGATVLLLDDRTSGETDQLIQSIAHGVINLKRLVSDFGAERRQINIIKLRGLKFEDGNHDYTIQSGGLVIYPRLKMSSKPPIFKTSPLPSGLKELDDLLGGAGLERGTGTLFIGPAGAGKSTIAAKFACTAAERGERSAVFIFDENLHTYIERAENLGMGILKHMEKGLITLKHVDAAELSPGEMAHEICAMADTGNVKVVIIDSLNGYLNAMPEEKFLLLQLHEMLAYLSQRGIASILVMAQHGLLGDMHSPADLTYLADTVLLLRYFEFKGAIKKSIAVIKKRSGGHENSIREFMIRDNRLVVGEPLRQFQGILKGIPNFLGGSDAMLTGQADKD